MFFGFNFLWIYGTNRDEFDHLSYTMTSSNLHLSDDEQKSIIKHQQRTSCIDSNIKKSKDKGFEHLASRRSRKSAKPKRFVIENTKELNTRGDKMVKGNFNKYLSKATFPINRKQTYIKNIDNRYSRDPHIKDKNSTLEYDNIRHRGDEVCINDCESSISEVSNLVKLQSLVKDKLTYTSYGNKLYDVLNPSKITATKIKPYLVTKSMSNLKRKYTKNCRSINNKRSKLHIE